MRNSISFYLNGEKKEVKGADVFLPLSSYLRYESRLTGTKVVCAEGDCGACTIMVAKWHPNANDDKYFSINSCIAMTFSMDGANLVTVEGLSANEKLSEVQCSMMRNFGGQCGFCTPGFVMSITNMHEHKDKPDMQNAKNYLTGNLCRCTGYSPILNAALDVDKAKHIKVKQQYPPVDMAQQMNESVLIQDGNCEYYAPATLAEASEYKAKHADVIVFSGSTDLGVQINKGHLQPKRIMSLHLIKELYTCEAKGSEITIGARVTLSETQNLIEDHVPSKDRFLHIFASPQIKNAATLVGNIANASPIADTTPVLMALDAVVDIYGQIGRRSVELKNFYLGYKKLDLKKDEIITHIRFKIPTHHHKIHNYKVSQRRDLDISTVNASFNFTMNGSKIESARIALGGVAATTIRLNDIENQIKGLEINKKNVEDIKKLISASINPLSDVRGTADYRKLLAANLFEKFAKEQLGL